MAFFYEDAYSIIPQRQHNPIYVPDLLYLVGMAKISIL